MTLGDSLWRSRLRWWLQRLRGRDCPAPLVGQVWRSARNGALMRVCGVRVHFSGLVFVDTQAYGGKAWGMVVVNIEAYKGGGDWGPAELFSCGVDSWRRRLRIERRVLIGHDTEMAAAAREAA